MKVLKPFAHLAGRSGVALAAMLVAAGVAAARPASAAPMHATTLINVSDLEKSIDYYSRFLGLKVVTRVPLGPDSWEVLLSPDGTETNTPLALIGHRANTPPVTHGGDYNRMAFSVTSPAQVDEATARVRAAGYAVIMGPASAAIPGGRTYRYSHFKDPDGYTVELTYFDPDHKNP